MWRRLARLWLEAVFFGAVGIFIALGWGLQYGGVLSIFLVAAGLTPRFHQLLEENRDLIWEEQRSGWAANALTARSMLAVFSGILTAYLVVAGVIGAEGIRMVFTPALQVAGATETGQALVRFSRFDALLTHNLSIVVSFFGLAFVYRTYAALVALAFSACVWGSLPVLALSQHRFEGLAARIGWITAATLGVIPTLLLEAAALVFGSLSAIYVSKGLVQYNLTDPRQFQVLRASLILLVLAVVAAALSSLTEWWLLSRIVGATVAAAG
jgi:hypothetical protein